MKAVILAGGKGTRMIEETEFRPKPMLEVGGMPIIWHIMKILTTHGVDEFIICLGYKGYMIKEYFANYFLHSRDVIIDTNDNSVKVLKEMSESWKISLIDTGFDTMTGGRLKQVGKYLDEDEPFLFTYGDGVSDVNITDLKKFHKEGSQKVSLTAVQPTGRFGSLGLDGGKVNCWVEKPAGDNAWINGGYFIMDSSVLSCIDNDRTSWEREPMEHLVKQGDVAAYRHNGFWQCMDTVRDHKYLNELWSTNKAPWKTWS